MAWGLFRKAAWRKRTFRRERMDPMSNTVLSIVQFGMRQCMFYYFQLRDLWSLLGSFFMSKVDFTAP